MAQKKAYQDKFVGRGRAQVGRYRFARLVSIIPEGSGERRTLC